VTRRLLSIDGGGVRGVVALEVLGRIEQVPRHETGDRELVLVCRVLGECRAGPSLDTELGDLVGGAGLLREALFAYVRYDAETHPASLEELGVGHLSAENLDRIDGVDFIEEMCEFGRAISTRVDPAHFAGF